MTMMTCDEFLDHLFRIMDSAELLETAIGEDELWDGEIKNIAKLKSEYYNVGESFVHALLLGKVSYEDAANVNVLELLRIYETYGVTLNRFIETFLQYRSTKSRNIALFTFSFLYGIQKGLEQAIDAFIDGIPVEDILA